MQRDHLQSFTPVEYTVGPLHAAIRPIFGLQVAPTFKDHHYGLYWDVLCHQVHLALDAGELLPGRVVRYGIGQILHSFIPDLHLHSCRLHWAR